MSRLGLALIVCLFGSGCANPMSSSTTPSANVSLTAPLTGTVSAAASGTPLSGATVRILDGVDSDLSTATTEGGAYRFLFLPVGNVNLAASATGYVEGRAGVYVDGKNTLDFALVLRTFVPLTGVVTSAATGERVSGVFVSVQPPHVDVGRNATTNSDGTYRLDIQPGNATIRASAKGYAVATASVLVDGTITLNFTLQPVP